MTEQFRHDGVGTFFGFRQTDPNEIRMTIRPELLNISGLLSGVCAYALIDYTMGTALWAQRNADELIATINISINYLVTKTEGEIICRAWVDRRNRRIAVLRAEVSHADDTLLATAIGSYSIFPRK